MHYLSFYFTSLHFTQLVNLAEPVPEVKKVPFATSWREEVEKRKHKLMKEEVRRRSTLKFKVCILQYGQI